MAFLAQKFELRDLQVGGFQRFLSELSTFENHGFGKPWDENHHEIHHHWWDNFWHFCEAFYANLSIWYFVFAWYMNYSPFLLILPMQGCVSIYQGHWENKWIVAFDTPHLCETWPFGTSWNAETLLKAWFLRGRVEDRLLLLSMLIDPVSKHLVFGINLVWVGLCSIRYTPQSLSLQNDGTGRRSGFLLGPFANFQGKFTVRLPGCDKIISILSTITSPKFKELIRKMMGLGKCISSFKYGNFGYLC